MERWFDPAHWGNCFSFSPLPAADVSLSEGEAVEIADRAMYLERWPDVQMATQYGVFDDGGRGETLILPPDFPKPPGPPGGWDSIPPREHHIWAMRRQEWHEEAERVGEIINHRNRLVWLVAFIGIVERDDPTRKVRVKVIDVAARRPIALYQQPIEPPQVQAG